VGGTCSTNGEKRNLYSLSVRKPEGNSLLGRPRRRWADNIEMNFVGEGYGGVDWIDLAQDRNYWRALVNEAMGSRVP
jgi:hypothetical protein